MQTLRNSGLVEQMKISLLHATRRPEAAIACQKLWMEMAENPSSIEIVTCVDHDDKASREAFPHAILNYGEGVVPAWNEAAKHAAGDILIPIDDDWICAAGYDQIVESYMCNGADILHVGDKHRKDQLICHPIISRNFYEAMGYLWHPLFKSVYCDNWFSEVAQRWGYVDATDGGKIDLGFVHANPSQGYGEEDDVAQVSNSKERYNHGAQMLARLQNQTILAFTVAGRTEYLQQSLASWLKTDLNLVTAVHFFIEPIDAFEIDAVIDSFSSNCPVPVIKHFNKEKLGVLRNPWHLFDHCFRIEGAKFVILGEDDFLVSPDVLNFFDLTKTDWTPTTMAVCAKWVGKRADGNPATFHRSMEFTGNIWMTSAPIWNSFLRDTWDFDYSSGNADGTSAGWDWNIQLRVMPKNDLHCIVPTASRSKHIGVTGVHCHEDVFGDTVAWNFLEEPYSGPYQEMTGVVRSNKTYDTSINVTTAGDIGDVVVALASIHHGGHKATLLLRDAGGTKGITDKIGFIKPFLMVQPYIEDVRLFNGEAVNWPAEGFRGGWVRDDYTLAMNHAEHALHCGIISTLPDLSQRWLFNIEPNKAFAGKVIINRSPRYNNPHFPWRKIVEFYGVRILFIGLKHEHEAFCNAYGHVAYQPVNDLLEVAQIIAGSFLFIGNQSSCMTIAEGMKHPRILEGSLSIPDCVYPGATNAQYVFDGGVELPTVDGQASLKIDAQAVTWKNYLMPNVVPDLGKGRIGWHFEFNGSVHSDGLMEFAVKKLKKLSGWDDEKCMREIVQYTVAMNPVWFSKRVKIPQFDAPKRALRNAGYTDHALLG